MTITHKRFYGLLNQAAMQRQIGVPESKSDIPILVFDGGPPVTVQAEKISPSGQAWLKAHS